MPVISSFDGLVIYIYKNDHNPPHLHVCFRDMESLVTIADGTIIEGDKLPKRQMRLLKKWCALHRTELLEMWEKSVFIKLEPLK